jgi:AraC-like DNA-binding protein
VIDSHTMLRLVFGAAGASAYLVLALVVMRAEGARAVRAAAFAAAVLSAIGFIVDSPLGASLHQSLPALDLSLRILAAGVPGALWLALVSLFRDRKARPRHVLLSLAPMAVAVPAYLLQAGPAVIVFWIWAAVSVGLILHAILVVVRTRHNDLVESRRRLRFVLSWVSIFGCAVLLMLLTTIAADVVGLSIAPWWTTALRGLMAATAIAGVPVFLDPRRQMIPPERKPPQAVEAHQALIGELEAAMITDEVWRQEGLTLAALASRLQTPEYRLRLVINGELGHRNFTEFVNGYRVEAAKGLLADPGSKPNIAQVAYGVGFASLAPFNRAFKEVTGVTPTQWRRDRLIEG